MKNKPDYKTMIYKAGLITKFIHSEPHKRNALHGHFILELSDALKRFQRDKEAAVGVLLSEGKIYCAGHNLEFVSEMDHYAPGEPRVRTEEDWREQLDFMRDNLYFPLWDCKKPLITGVQGGAYAGGVILALYCDIIVAAQDAVFDFSVCRVSGAGLGGAILPYFIGYRKAIEIALTGWNISATEAEKLGLVNKVVAAEKLEEEVNRYANILALMPPETLKLQKQAAKFAMNRMGFRDSIWFGAETDILAHGAKNEREKEFYKILKEQGMKAAVEYKDKPFEKFGFTRKPR